MRLYQGVILAMLISTPAAAVECIASPPAKSYSWRMIDGKRCYYIGRHRLEKTVLHWGRPKVATSRLRLPPQPTPSEEDEIEVLKDSTVWPALPDAPKHQDRILTPQQRIDEAFKCLTMHQRGYRCE